jgi:hypothetical protein
MLMRPSLAFSGSILKCVAYSSGGFKFMLKPFQKWWEGVKEKDGDGESN